jgi:hypothetical protein
MSSLPNEMSVIYVIIAITIIGWSDGWKADTRLAKASTGMVFWLQDRFSPHHRIAGGNYSRSVMMGA